MIEELKPLKLDVWFNEARESYIMQALPKAPACGSLEPLNDLWQASPSSAPEQVGFPEAFEDLPRAVLEDYQDCVADLYHDAIESSSTIVQPRDIHAINTKLLQPEIEVDLQELPHSAFNGRVSTEQLSKTSHNQRDRAWFAIGDQLARGFVPTLLTHDVQSGADPARPGLHTIIAAAAVGLVNGIWLSTLDRFKRSKHPFIDLDLCFAVSGNLFHERKAVEGVFMEYVPTDKEACGHAATDFGEAYVGNLTEAHRKARGSTSKLHRTRQSDVSVRSHLFFKARRDA